jgi:hypothetical protein
MRGFVITITLYFYEALLIVCSAILCFSGAIAGAIGGTAYELGWPLSGPNLQMALTFGAICGLIGGGTTMLAALSVRPTPAVCLLVIGSILTSLGSGAGIFVKIAWSAAC